MQECEGNSSGMSSPRVESVGDPRAALIANTQLRRVLAPLASVFRRSLQHLSSLAASPAGSLPSVSTKKPRSRGFFSSLFCCLCRDQPEPQPVNNNAPLLVEENGTVSKVQLKPLLPPVKSKDSGKICVVIDLDETLVHSSFKVADCACSSSPASLLPR